MSNTFGRVVVVLWATIAEHLAQGSKLEPPGKFVSSSDVLATSDSTIRFGDSMQRTNSRIDLNLAPVLSSEEQTSMDSRAECQDIELGEIYKKRNGFSKSTLNANPQDVLYKNLDSQLSSSLSSSTLKTPENPMKRRKSDLQDICTRKSVASKILGCNTKMRLLEDIYKSKNTSEQSNSIPMSTRITSKSMSSKKQTSRCQAYKVGLRQSNGQKDRLKALKTNKQSTEDDKGEQSETPSKSLHNKDSLLTLDPVLQREQSYVKVSEQEELSEELLALISLIKNAQMPRRFSKGVVSQPKYPPAFKKKVVETRGQFLTLEEAAAFHNIPRSCVSTWIKEYIESGYDLNCWNYIEEREKYKKKVVGWHKTSGNDNVSQTARLFHIHRHTLTSWIKEQDMPDGFESFLSRETPTSYLRMAPYPKEVKKAVVEYYQKSGKHQTEVAELCGIDNKLISRWQSQLKQEKEKGRDELHVHPDFQNPNLTEGSPQNGPRMGKSKKRKILT
ncbi:hypothetical protein DFH28DRAFT_933248 [Melampsora americana]|nr:hypothetical protein DFH28DRAFT_933248 [Melampsora americana]